MQYSTDLRAVFGARGPLEAAGGVEGVRLVGGQRQASPRHTRRTAHPPNPTQTSTVVGGAVPAPPWLRCTRGVVVVAGVGGVGGGVHFVVDVLAGLPTHRETEEICRTVMYGTVPYGMTGRSDGAS